LLVAATEHTRYGTVVAAIVGLGGNTTGVGSDVVVAKRQPLVATPTWPTEVTAAVPSPVARQVRAAGHGAGGGMDSIAASSVFCSLPVVRHAVFRGATSWRVFMGEYRQAFGAVMHADGDDEPAPRSLSIAELRMSLARAFRSLCVLCWL
jgi:hypothetical protein